VKENDAGLRRLRQTRIGPEEEITGKIRRRVVSGKQCTLVYWRIKAGPHAVAHKHPHEQFVWWSKAQWVFALAMKGEQ
jgi:quercetin dioxygenase-like cupin family protein